jgi:tRNA-dihydrouridine synthase
MLRRHLAKYFPGLPNFRELRIKLLRAETSEEVNEILKDIVDIYGSTTVDHSTSDLG